MESLKCTFQTENCWHRNKGHCSLEDRIVLWFGAEDLDPPKWKPVLSVPTLCSHQLNLREVNASPVSIIFLPYFKKIFLMFIQFWETEHELRGEGQRERETKNPKQAPGSELSTQSPSQGSNPWITDHDLLLNPLSYLAPLTYQIEVIPISQGWNKGKMRKCM